MGGVGGLFLLLSTVSLLYNIEGSLNEIWGVTEARSLMQRGLIYWGVLTLGPIALGTSLLASGALQRTAVDSGLVPESLLALVPLAATVLLLTFLYLAAPNAPVRLRAALGAGLVAGALWEVAKHAWGLWAGRLFRYSAIYGSLGAVPLFLLWVYLSWLLVLFGARLAYALQHATRPSALAVPGPRAREILCARIALLAVGDFLRGGEPKQPARIARALEAEAFAVDDAVQRLRGAGLLAEAGNGGVVPARPPDQIHLQDVSRAARDEPSGAGEGGATSDADETLLASLFAEADRESQRALARADLASLWARLQGGGEAGAPSGPPPQP
jgi:membrane protein